MGIHRLCRISGFSLDSYRVGIGNLICRYRCRSRRYLSSLCSLLGYGCIIDMGTDISGSGC